MVITVLETMFEVGDLKKTMLAMQPTQDMHEIEERESYFDKIQMPYALVECRTITRDKNVFLGWSLITQLPL